MFFFTGPVLLRAASTCCGRGNRSRLKWLSKAAGPEAAMRSRLVRLQRWRRRFTISSKEPLERRPGSPSLIVLAFGLTSPIQVPAPPAVGLFSALLDAWEHRAA